MSRASAAPVSVAGEQQPSPVAGSTAAVLARGCITVDLTDAEADRTALIFFVPFTLVNTKNNLTGHWSSKGAYTRRLRQATHLYCHVAALRAKWTAPSAQPKLIRFVAHVGHLMDSQDGLRVTLAPALDGLGPCAHARGGPGCNHAYMIDDDADRRGHRIVYSQTVSRPRGVLVTVVA